MELKIAKLTPDKIDNLTNLLDVCFTIRARPKNRAVRWKYFQRDFPNISYLYLDWNKVVSFYSNILVPVALKGKQYKAGVCLDMATHPDYRGQGLISKLSQVVYKEAVEKNYDFSYGFSNQYGILVDKNSANYGYKVVGEFGLFCKLLIKTQKTNLSAIEIESFFQGGVINNYFQINTSKSYLDWRYLNQPSKKYLILGIKKGEEIVSYVILNRKSRQKLEVLKIINLVDDIDIKDIIRVLQNYGFKNDYKFLFIFVLKNNFWKKELKQAKFFKVPNRSKFYLTVKEHKSVKGVLNKDNWLLMGGDII